MEESLDSLFLVQGIRGYFNSADGRHRLEHGDQFILGCLGSVLGRAVALVKGKGLDLGGRYLNVVG